MSAASHAWAQQHAQDNAVTVADDAFGTSVGLQNVGLYSQNDARGFDPQQAGNLRIEGLYFDQQAFITNPCMVRETAMRIGIAAQAYSFPSPTGIADFSLRVPGEEQTFSALASHGPFATTTVQLEAQIPLKPKELAVDLCGGYDWNSGIDFFRRDGSSIFGTTVRWSPVERTVFTPFFSYMVGGGHQSLPAVYTDGTDPLPQFRLRDLATQTWATMGWRSTTYGTVIKSEWTDRWQFTAGAFHSKENDPWEFEPYLQLNPNGTADSVMDVSPPQTADSTSGEARLTGLATSGVRRQQLDLAIRGRTVNRTYGGDDIIDFGTVTLQDPAQFAQPPLVFTPRSDDRIRQLDVGATYEERWQGIGSAAIGVLKDNYRRTTDVPTLGSSTYRTTPWLFNGRLTFGDGGPLLYYGSYTQGLEGSALAPVNAVNRGEPPAASRTWQVDSGIKYVPNPKLRMILGAFEIHKPYLNLDAENVYGPLGQLKYSGMESSLSYANAGLTILAGGVWIRPQLSLDVAQPGMGSEPLGPVPLTLTADVDYAPAAWGPWAASLDWKWLSSRDATSNDQQKLPVLATIAAGVRYQLKLGGKSATLRLDGFNLTNTQGLHISPLYQILPEQVRRFSATLAVDL